MTKMKLSLLCFLLLFYGCTLFPVSNIDYEYECVSEKEQAEYNTFLATCLSKGVYWETCMMVGKAMNCHKEQYVSFLWSDSKYFCYKRQTYFHKLTDRASTEIAALCNNK